MIEIDFGATSAILLNAITFPVTHDIGTPSTSDDIRFWWFDSITQCQNTPSSCGLSQYIDDDLPAGVVDTRANVLSAAYYGLAVDATRQLLLDAATPLTIGKMNVTLPGVGGIYVLNLLNAADADGINRRSRVDYGFEPHTIWRAGSAAPNDLTGGTFSFDVVDSCGGDVPKNFFSSVPVHTAVGVQAAPPQGSLWRSARNTLRLTFSGALSAAPTSGQIEIVELLAAGAFGANVGTAANGFTFTLESGNTVLRIRDDDATSNFTAGRWFAIRNTGGWASATNFEIHFPAQVGDANGDNSTLFTDLGFINTQVPTAAPIPVLPDANRRDVNGDGSILFSDLGAANARVPNAPITKPTGH
jgi:hypothetical protein